MRWYGFQTVCMHVFLGHWLHEEVGDILPVTGRNKEETCSTQRRAEIFRLVWHDEGDVRNINKCLFRLAYSLRLRHNGHDRVSNHQPHYCLLNRLFRRRSKKASKLRVTGLCAGNSPETVDFPAQMASNAENVFIWWRHHVICTVNWCDCVS